MNGLGRTQKIKEQSKNKKSGMMREERAVGESSGFAWI